ncbi:MAG: M55 family metallopeptidase [Lachnospiraceae bacterium]|jgi:D-amino peptidase|nr:M55 family metallopeptidase [Lachnospiraceae bacterium]
MEQRTYFISADLEGAADVTAWCETEKGGDGYEEARLQMSREAAAACEAVLAAGYQVVVRDGHESARNILHGLLPRGAKLMRGWACHPGSMMAGISEKYAGALYVGYHSPAGTDGSPLAHTMDRNEIRWVKINGKLASEFTLNSMYAAQMGVPSVFISGDETICRLAGEEVPQIQTVAVKECRGNSTFNLHPEEACDKIRAGVAEALKRQAPVRELPAEFVLEVSLVRHQTLRAALANPGISQIDTDTVRYTARSPRELNTVLSYIMA